VPLSCRSSKIYQNFNILPFILFYFAAYFCYQKCRLKEQPLTFGALSVLKHLLPRFLLFLLYVIIIYTGTYKKKKKIFSYRNRLSYNFYCRLSEAWHSKRPLLVEAVNFLLDEQNLGVRKALAEVGCYELIVLEFLLISFFF
jgi:hypothetical protein